MRACARYIVLTSALLIVGCSARPQQRQAKVPELFCQSDRAQLASATASALVYDPPVIANEPPLDLARDGREPVAVLGYEQLITSFSYTRSDDRFRVNFDNGDRYERRAVSERVGVIY